MFVKVERRLRKTMHRYNEAFYANLRSSKVKLSSKRRNFCCKNQHMYLFPFYIPDILLNQLCNGAVCRVTVTFEEKNFNFFKAVVILSRLF